MSWDSAVFKILKRILFFGHGVLKDTTAMFSVVIRHIVPLTYIATLIDHHAVTTSSFSNKLNIES